ncbi:MAG: DUF1800 family protein [Pseudomonadota bacterium]
MHQQRDLTWKACAPAIAALAVAACSGGGGGSSDPASTGGGGGSPPASSSPPPPPPPPAVTGLDSQVEVARFVTQAGFGATSQELLALVGADAADWTEAQINTAPTLYLPGLLQQENSGEDIGNRAHSPLFWNAMMSGDDQLRQRMVFALSQIIVVSDDSMAGESLEMAYYVDILSRNAFGNYRDILQEVTYSPAMADYLTYLRNRKADDRTGRMPDENYARELLQLFTIGLVELNMDGTPRLNGSGDPIETYTNDDVEGLARVFTGLGYKGTSFSNRDRDDDYASSPLQMYADQHSEKEKAFLGTVIPAGTPGDETIDRALDAIFEHPNMAPFLSRQLIQRFTASNPSPAYVQRVATAFEAGSFVSPDGSRFGTGQRGDLEATIAAILLDDVVHSETSLEDPGAGKIREPILKYVHWARAFNVSNADAGEQGRFNDTRRTSDRLGQHPFRSPSVFNFYRPGFIAPGTESGSAGLTAPELQLINSGTTFGYSNWMTDFAFERVRRSGVQQFVPDYSAELALAETPEALVDHLDLLLTAGTLEDEARTDIVNALNALVITDSNAESDRQRRVRAAVLMVADSAAFAVVR